MPVLRPHDLSQRQRLVRAHDHPAGLAGGRAGLVPHPRRPSSTTRSSAAGTPADSLVFRYGLAASPDGLAGAEGTFSLCSFWYVEALTHTGRTEDARLALEKMSTYATPLGLYAIHLDRALG
jgi:hypothetical protein